MGPTKESKDVHWFVIPASDKNTLQIVRVPFSMRKLVSKAKKKKSMYERSTEGKKAELP